MKEKKLNQQGNNQRPIIQFHLRKNKKRRKIQQNEHRLTENEDPRKENNKDVGGPIAKPLSVPDQILQICHQTFEAMDTLDSKPKNSLPLIQIVIEC